MSVSDKYGYRYGQRLPVKLPVDSSSTVPIEVGDMLALATAGYVKQAAAGDKIVGVAMSRLETAPAADGESSVLVDISEQSVYAYPGSTTVSQGKLMLTCDVGGARAIDETASSDDCIRIVGVDAANNLYLVQPILVLAGVV